MKNNCNRSRDRKLTPIPPFVARAQRAFRRVARKVRLEHRKLGLPLIVWENGKIVKKAA